MSLIFLQFKPTKKAIIKDFSLTITYKIEWISWNAYPLSL